MPLSGITYTMNWSITLGRVRGIEVRVHLTFFLMLLFFGLYYFQAGGMPAALKGVLFTCLIFVCVLLHEFGHALAAARYGIRTPDITLLPIGGLARLERMPDKPVQELVVAIAGPLVNVAIALLLLPIVYGRLTVEHLLSPNVDLLPRLFVANVVLIVFNMIPAFPMDGGRVLRSLLAMQMDYSKATNIAATIGQGLAFVGGFYGLTQGNLMLVLVAVFIFFGAQSEATHAQVRRFTQGMRVNSAMITHFEALPPQATLNEAVDALLRTSQHDFPIVQPDGEVAGILARSDLIVALRKSGPATPVTEVMRTGVPTLLPGMHFDRALQILQQSESPALPVLDYTGRLVGLFTAENVGELIMIQNALSQSPTPPSPAKRAEPPPLPA